MAERQGFEPWVLAKVQRFSRPPRSTTPAPLRGERGKYSPMRGIARGQTGSGSRSSDRRRNCVSLSSNKPAAFNCISELCRA